MIRAGDLAELKRLLARAAEIVGAATEAAPSKRPRRESIEWGYVVPEVVKRMPATFTAADVLAAIERSRPSDHWRVANPLQRMVIAGQLLSEDGPQVKGRVYRKVKTA